MSSPTPPGRRPRPCGSASGIPIRPGRRAERPRSRRPTRPCSADPELLFEHVRLDHRDPRPGLEEPSVAHLGARQRRCAGVPGVRSRLMEIPSPKGCPLRRRVPARVHADACRGAAQGGQRDRRHRYRGQQRRQRRRSGCPAAAGTASYEQVKFVITQRELLSYRWFMETPPGVKKSILKRFHDSFIALTDSDGTRPEMTLVTNRGRDGNDPVLGHSDGRDDKLMPRLTSVGAASAAGKALAEWADHLGVRARNSTRCSGTYGSVRTCTRSRRQGPVPSVPRVLRLPRRPRSGRCVHRGRPRPCHRRTRSAFGHRPQAVGADHPRPQPCLESRRHAGACGASIRAPGPRPRRPASVDRRLQAQRPRP